MAILGRERQPIDRLEAFNVAQRFAAERRFAFQGVEGDAFQKIAQGKVEVLGQTLQDFDQPLFHARANLDPDNPPFLLRLYVCYCYIVTQIRQGLVRRMSGSSGLCLPRKARFSRS